MRWKVFFSIFTIVFIYTIFPLLMSATGEVLAKHYYECQERASNAHIPIGIYLNCPRNDLALTTRLQNIVNINLLAILTLPTGVFAIASLVIVQVSSVFLKSIGKRKP